MANVDACLRRRDRRTDWTDQTGLGERRSHRLLISGHIGADGCGEPGVTVAASRSSCPGHGSRSGPRQPRLLAPGRAWPLRQQVEVGRGEHSARWARRSWPRPVGRCRGCCRCSAALDQVLAARPGRRQPRRGTAVRSGWRFQASFAVEEVRGRGDRHPCCRKCSSRLKAVVAVRRPASAASLPRPFLVAGRLALWEAHAPDDQMSSISSG